MPPKDQRKLDKFIVFGMAAAEQAVEDSGWKPEDEEDRNRTGVLIGSGIGGLQTIYETALILQERGPRRVSPFFIPVGADQPRLRPRLDQVRLQGPEPLGGDGLRHRRARDRRRRAADPAGRCRRDGRRRHRGRDLPPRHRRLPACAALSTEFNDTPTKASRPGTRTATASSWARARASSCSRNTSTPRSAAPRSTPRSSATACPATPTTSPRRPRTATAPSAPCRRR